MPVKKAGKDGGISQIKAASKTCCFVKSDRKTLVICSQNTSIKNEVHSSLQQYNIPTESVAKAVELVLDAYPKYVPMDGTGPLASLVANESVVSQCLMELAELQVFIVV